MCYLPGHSSSSVNDRPGVRKALITEKSKFDQFFSADLVQFQDNDGSPMPRPVVFCSDIVEFINKLVEQRMFDHGDFKL